MPYRTKSVYVGHDDNGDVMMTADEIIIEDANPRPTGLLDSRGDEIYRVRDRIPFGFVGPTKTTSKPPVHLPAEPSRSRR